MDREAAFSAVSEQKIKNGAILIALQWLQINQERLKKCSNLKKS